jgi:hypothetical protein
MTIDRGTWIHAGLSAAGLVCVTVLAALRDIGGQTALIAIVSILGVGGVNTVLSGLAGTLTRAGNAGPAPAGTDRTGGV